MKRKRAKAGVEPQVFRLIVHIGAGKTGTSSIQQTLRLSRDALRNTGTVYLGQNLEFAPVSRYNWQKPGQIRRLLELDREEANRQAIDVLADSIATLKAEGASQAIWSNEWFFRRSQFVIEALRHIADSGVDVAIVAYVRRHDAWARSSYIQWGLKDKTNKGELQSFSEYCSRRPVSFATDLGHWREVLNRKVHVRNMDAVGDSVADFLRFAGIDPSAVKIERRNESPTLEDLALRTIFNSQFDDKISPAAFTAAIGTKKAPGEISIDDWLAALLPTQNDLNGIIERSAADRTLLNSWLAESGQPPIETTPLPAKSNSVDHGKVTAALAHIAMRQAARIHAIEEKLAMLDAAQASTAPLPEGLMNTSLDHDAPDKPSTAQSASGAAACENPVFAISTGRSGSTLVQRMLNCHKDLVIWGEHFGFLNGLGQSYLQMSSTEQKLYPLTAAANKGPALLLPTLNDPAVGLEWANPWSAEDFASQMRAFIGGYFGSRLDPRQRWGFKEIRYNNMPVLRMLHELYPQGRFVFIRRDVEEVTRSKVSAFVKEARWSAMSAAEQSERVRKLIAEVREHYRIYDVFMKRFPGMGQAVDFENLIENPRAIVTGLLNHLGLDPDRYDWDLAEQVLASIITRTKRDPDVIDLISKIAAQSDDAASTAQTG